LTITKLTSIGNVACFCEFIKVETNNAAEKERERANIERERKQQDERRKAAEQEDRRREEARARERERERERDREEARIQEEARAREEAIQRQKADQLKAQADAAAKREQQREKERQRQREEIEQLKRDKLELDRRASERDKQREREGRRYEEEEKKKKDDEKRRLDEAKREKMISMQEKLEVMQDVVRRIEPRQNTNHPQARAEEKSQAYFDDDDRDAAVILSARERVLQRKKEKSAKEEAERVEALREAENENRRIRAMASNQALSQFHNPEVAAGGLTSRGSRQSSHDALADEDKASAPSSRMLSGGGGSSNMDAQELTERLKQATSGRSSRFSDSTSNRESDHTPTGQSQSSDARRPSSDGRSQGRDTGRSSEATTVRANFGGLDINDEDDSFEDDGDNIFLRGGNVSAGDDDDADEDEDMKKKEEELKAELQFATMRCEELKRTLQETKSYIAPVAVNGGKVGAATGPSQRTAATGAGNDNLDDEEEEDGDEYEEGDDYDYGDSVEYEESWADDEPPTSSNSGKSMGVSIETHNSSDSHITPRKLRPQALAVRESPFTGLQDPPTPTGRLSDRIERLRLRCIEALGRDSFLDAYRFLKQYDDMYSSRSYEDDEEEEKLVKMRAILGDSKAHYTPLIEQLIFMEETHRP